jgi:Leucine-rich repeat (LRR) protein
LKTLSLTHLRLDHNIVEYLDDDLFEAELGASLKYFSAHDNNILQIPQSAVKLNPGSTYLYVYTYKHSYLMNIYTVY